MHTYQTLDGGRKHQEGQGERERAIEREREREREREGGTRNMQGSGTISFHAPFYIHTVSVKLLEK